MNAKPALTIRELYPHLNEQELAQVEDTFDQYLALVLRIYERMELEMVPQADLLSPTVGLLSSTLPDSDSSAYQHNSPS